jgi:hypothetical protein
MGVVRRFQRSLLNEFDDYQLWELLYATAPLVPDYGFPDYGRGDGRRIAEMRDTEVILEIWDRRERELLDLWVTAWEPAKAGVFTYREGDPDHYRQFLPGGYGRRPLGWYLHKTERDRSPRWWDIDSDEALRVGELEPQYLKRVGALLPGEAQLIAGPGEPPPWWEPPEGAGAV